MIDILQAFFDWLPDLPPAVIGIWMIAAMLLPAVSGSVRMLVSVPVTPPRAPAQRRVSK